MFDACICVEPDEVCALISRRRYTARKRHTCGECRQSIEPGQEYEVDTVANGRVTRHKICLPCLRIRNSLFSCGWYYGGMWDTVHETYCGYDDDDDYFCICPGG